MPLVYFCGCLLVGVGVGVMEERDGGEEVRKGLGGGRDGGVQHRKRNKQ